MAKYRIVRTDFWKNPMILEEMGPEDKYFYLYLLTNPYTTQIGIYQLTRKQMAFDLGYSIETVHSLMERFVLHYKLIRYNPETRELALKNWGKENLHKGGKPVMDCIYAELKEVVDSSLIQYVAESISKQEIRSLYESFCEQDRMSFGKEESVRDENATYLDTGNAVLDDTSAQPYTIRGQKEKEKQKENKKEKQQQEENKKEEILQQKEYHPHIVDNPVLGNPLQNHQKDVKEILEFWDCNGFGLTNINAKHQLLNWLDDSSFLQSKEIIIKAMNIASASNKPRLNYIVGILKNWENESLLMVDDIVSRSS